MKVLHINSYYSISKFYKNLYDKQVKYGLDIDVFVPVPYSKELNGYYFGEYTTISPNHNRYDRFLFHRKHSKIYKDIVDRYEIERFTLIHAHSLFSNGYIAYKLKRTYGIPYIVAVRNTDVNVFFKRMPHLKKLGIAILKEAEKVIFLSESYRSYLFKTYIPNKIVSGMYKKTEIIPNGIDDFWFQNKVTRKEAPKNNNLKIIYVGVINKNKNILTTIKAMEILREKGINVTYTVVGKIEDNTIYKAIKNLSYVNYISPKPKEDLITLYRENDIFVMPSITETFGIVYAESMSQGLPIIYTKGQGFDGQFEEGVVGYHIHPQRPEEIANAIESIMKNYEKLSKACIKLSNKFVWHKISSNYTDIYKKSMKEK